MKVTKLYDSPLNEVFQQFEARMLPDGSLELMIKDSTKKNYGKAKWTTRNVWMVLDEKHVGDLRALLNSPTD